MVAAWSTAQQQLKNRWAVKCHMYIYVRLRLTKPNCNSLQLLCAFSVSESMGKGGRVVWDLMSRKCHNCHTFSYSRKHYSLHHGEKTVANASQSQYDSNPNQSTNCGIFCYSSTFTPEVRTEDGVKPEFLTVNMSKNVCRKTFSVLPILTKQLHCVVVYL